MRLDRLDGEHIDRLAQRARRMDDRRIDPRLRHLLQEIVLRIGRDLPVVRRHLAVFPNMHLRIDDAHALLPNAPRAARGSVGRELKWPGRNGEAESEVRGDCLGIRSLL